MQVEKYCLIILLIIGLVQFSYGKTEFKPNSNNLYYLEDKNFQDALQEFPYLMVLFSSHGNEEGDKLSALLANISTSYKDQVPQVAFAEMSSYQSGNTTSKYQIARYPSILFFQNSVKMVYQSGYTIKEMIAWIQRILNEQLVIEINDNTELKQQIKEHELLLFYFVEDEKVKGFEEFKQAALEYNDIQFAYSFSSTLRDQYNTGNNQLQLFTKFDKKKNTLNGPFTVQQIGSFIEKHSYADLMPYNQRAKQKIYYKFIPAMILFTDDSEQGKKAEEVFQSVVKANKGKILFTITKPNDGFELFETISEKFSVRKNMLPAIRIQGFQGGESMYKYEDQFEQKSIEKFIMQFRLRKLKQYYQSEPIPDNSQNHVKIIVADTFQQEVIQSDKHVLMDFWANWCIACKNFEPTLEKIGKRLSKNPNIIIGKLNIGKNEIPDLKTDGLPYIRFYKKGQKKNPIKLEPGQTVDEYVKLILKHTNNEVIDYKDEL